MLVYWMKKVMNDFAKEMHSDKKKLQLIKALEIDL